MMMTTTSMVTKDSILTELSALSLVDVVTRSVKDCLQEEFELLVEDAIAVEGRQDEQVDKKGSETEGRNTENYDDKGETKAKSSDQISVLHSVGTSILNEEDLVDDESADDERSDFLSCKSSPIYKVPSRISFMSRGRSFLGLVGESNRHRLREIASLVDDDREPHEESSHASEEELNLHRILRLKKEIRLKRRWLRKEGKQKARAKNTSASSIVSLDPAETLVPSGDGVEILVRTKDNKQSRWHLGRFSRRKY